MVREAAFDASGFCASILRDERKSASQPTGSDPPAVEQDPQLEQNLKDLLASDLASLTLGQLLGMVLSGVSLGERRAHLRDHDSELANGFFQRNVNVGSVAAPVRVPRTRSGAFRPQVLPASYQRGYSEPSQELILGLLASARSIDGVRRSLRQMGVSVPEADLQHVVDSLVEELALLNTRTLEPDCLVVFMDAKHIEVRSGKRLVQAAIHTAVGIDMQGRKQILSCQVREGAENLEHWKEVERNLLDRGLRRVLLFVQDAFSGLAAVTAGMFPQCEVQLCTVHMLRNARKHLSKQDFRIFRSDWQGVRSAWDPELGARRFEALCERFSARYGTWIGYLRRHRRQLLAFLGYPSRVRASWSTTNTAEAVNGQLEVLRRNAGGWFQSKRSLECKLALAVRQLHRGRWKSPDRRVCAELPALLSLFRQRFEPAGAD